MAAIDGWAFPGTQDATKGISVLQEASSKHVSCKESHSYKGDISKVPLQRKQGLEIHFSLMLAQLLIFTP